MKSRFRPRRSVRYPNSSAPATAPSRYHVPAELACLVVRFSVSDFVRTLASEPTSVTSKPSRIHVIPSPTTTIQCHLLHGSRSSRRGIIVSTTPPVAPRPPLAAAAVIEARPPPASAPHPSPSRQNTNRPSANASTPAPANSTTPPRRALGHDQRRSCHEPHVARRQLDEHVVELAGRQRLLERGENGMDSRPRFLRRAAELRRDPFDEFRRSQRFCVLSDGDRRLERLGQLRQHVTRFVTGEPVGECLHDCVRNTFGLGAFGSRAFTHVFDELV